MLFLSARVLPMWLKSRLAGIIAGPRGFLPQVVRDSNCVHNTCPVSSSNVGDFIFSQLITRVFCKANECFFTDSITSVLVFGPLGSGSAVIFTDPDPDPFINKQKNKINHEFFCFVTSQ
jgi:hypothetical protein